MISRRLVLIFAAMCLGATIMAGGGSCRSRSEERAVPPPASSISRQTLDEEVIETALVDLATSSDEESDVLRREQGKGRVVFSGESRDWVGTLRQELNSAESEQWKSLGSADRKAAKEAGANIINRVERKQHFAAFRPKDPHIVLWEDDPASTRPADRFGRLQGSRPITAAPPGYADQGRLAVVVLSFAWSIHGGDASYVLRFEGKKWKVISRHFAYYV
jgi:hypothetical protein